MAMAAVPNLVYAISGEVFNTAVFTVCAVATYYWHRKVVKHEERMHESMQQIRGGVRI